MMGVLLVLFSIVFILGCMVNIHLVNRVYDLEMDLKHLKNIIEIMRNQS
jgi:hypothetical protein